MAKYTVTHACGHNQVHDLLGPGRERERKLAWLKTTVCKECWAKQMREEKARMPVVMSVETNGLEEDPDGDLLAYIVLDGGVDKDLAKSLGYRWGEMGGNLMEVTFGGRPRKAWRKVVKLVSLLDRDGDTIKWLESDRLALGATLTNKISDVDIAMVQKRLREKAQQAERQRKIDEAISQIPKPQRPDCHPANVPGCAKGAWNGKYYGSEKTGWYYFVGGKKYHISNEQYAILMDYRKKWEDYQSQIEKIKASIT